MDTTEDGLCQLIIESGDLPLEWRDEPLFHECLTELTACGLEKLSAEPRRLEEAHRHLQEKNQELASSNYQTFIHTADCSKEIARDFKTVEEQLEMLLERIPEFSNSCEQFMTQAHSISAARRLSSLTLQKHTQVLEILEIPQLMDTCVRNAHYDEALELVAYVKRLERKHNGIAVIASIVGEVRRSTQTLLHQLIGQLKGELKLPACLKVIGYLRRMDIFSERELRLKFLQARDVWLQGLLAGIPRDDPFHHLTKVIEVTRVNIFDIITQYRAVFSDDDPLQLATIGAHESALFHSWLSLKIAQFLSTLEADLVRGGDSVASRFDTLLGQCMYFGLSFGRVGCDFRGRLPEIFQRAILVHFRNALETGGREFEEAIHRYSLTLPAGAAPSSRAASVTDSSEIPPPLRLLLFPPLSLLANQIITALNRLRLCCSLNLSRDVCAALHQQLSACIRAILELHRTEASTFTSNETEAFAELCEAMVDELMTHVNHCLSTLFPAKELAVYLGLSHLEVERRKLGGIDVETLAEPLTKFLPEKKIVPLPEEERKKETIQENEKLHGATSREENGKDIEGVVVEENPLTDDVQIKDDAEMTKQTDEFQDTENDVKDSEENVEDTENRDSEIEEQSMETETLD